MEAFDKILIRSEGPENYVLANLIKTKIIDKTIIDIEINQRSRYRNNKFGFDLIKENLGNIKIQNVFVCGKNTYIKLSNKLKTFYLELIPRGTGVFKGFIPKEWCVNFKLNDNSNLCFCDEKNYGLLKVIDENSFIERTSSILFDPLDSSKEYNFKSIKNHIKKSKCLAASLLNDRVFPGIGIYLRSEILYHAKMFPYKITTHMKDDEIKSLLESIRYVYKLSCNSNGIINQIYDESNIINQSFFNKCNVFYKKTDSLGNRVILSIRPEDSRTVFFVKEIQGYDE